MTTFAKTADITIRKEARAADKAARDAERKHNHYLKLAVLLRQGRLHRMSIDGDHTEHTFADGEHVDFYASGTYGGFAYMVVSGANGYECGCEQFAHRADGCKHTRDAAARGNARYHAQQELAVAAEVMPELASDLREHVEDELSSQRAAHIAHIADTDPTFNRVYGALVFGTVNTLEDISRRAVCERNLVVNTLDTLRSWGWIVIRKVVSGQYWIDTPEMAYRQAYSGDYSDAA